MAHSVEADKQPSFAPRKFKFPTDAAGRQVELITGSPDPVVRIRAVHPDRAVEIQGRLSDPRFFDELEALNGDGYNVYVVAQPTKPLKARGYCTHDSDVTGVRCAYVDGDESELPAHWHLEPDLLLVHPETHRWWAYWRVEGVTVEALPDVIARLAARYGGDPKITNPSRIVRLAGFDRWKHGKNFGPYELRELTGDPAAPATLAEICQGLPPAPKHKREQTGTAQGDDDIDEESLREALRHIDPGCKYPDWRDVVFGVEHARIARPDGSMFDVADKADLLDEWSCGELGGFEPPNYEGRERVEVAFDDALKRAAERGPREPAIGVGSLVHRAKLGGMDEAAFRAMRHRNRDPIAGYFKPVEQPADAGSPERKGKFRIVDRGGMENISPPSWLIPDLLPVEAYALLFGEPGTFKTFLALDIALNVATGSTAGVFDAAVDPGPVLFAAGEGRAKLTERVRAWEKRHNCERMANGFYLIDPVPLVSAGDREWDAFVAEALAASPDGFRLVVLDTISRAMQGANENAQEDASKFTALVDLLRRKLGCAVLALHHTPLNAQREKGSGTFRADADVSVSVERQGRDRIVSLTMPKQRDWSEWESPRIAQLDLVHLAADVASLAVVKPGADTEATAKAEAEAASPARARRGRGTRTDLDDGALRLLDKVVCEVLSKNPGGVWTQKELADHLALREDIEVESETLRTRSLTRLREAKGTKANRLKLYTARGHNKGWCWRSGLVGEE